MYWPEKVDEVLGVWNTIGEAGAKLLLCQINQGVFKPSHIFHWRKPGIERKYKKTYIAVERRPL